MARSYGKLTSTIWTDTDFRALPNTTTQLLYLALISQPDVSACGRLSVATRRWASGMAGVDRDEVEDSLMDLEEAQFVWVDYETDELIVRSFVKHDNGISNPRRLAAIRNAVTEITSAELRTLLLKEYPALKSDDYGERFDTVSANGSANESRNSPVPYQQATINKQQASAHLTDAAATALEMFVGWRMSSETDVRSPERYAQRIRTSEMQSRGEQLRTTALEEPKQILVDIFGLSKSHAVQAVALHRRTNQ